MSRQEAGSGGGPGVGVAIRIRIRIQGRSCVTLSQASPDRAVAESFQDQGPRQASHVPPASDPPCTGVHLVEACAVWPLPSPTVPPSSGNRGADADSLIKTVVGRAAWPAMVQAWLRLRLGMLEKRVLCGTSSCHDPWLRLRLGPGLSSDNDLVADWASRGSQTGCVRLGAPKARRLGTTAVQSRRDTSAMAGIAPLVVCSSGDLGRQAGLGSVFNKSQLSSVLATELSSLHGGSTRSRSSSPEAFLQPPAASHRVRVSDHGAVD